MKNRRLFAKHEVGGVAVSKMSGPQPIFATLDFFIEVMVLPKGPADSTICEIKMLKETSENSGVVPDVSIDLLKPVAFWSRDLAS